jgi:hypothetical protein
MSLTFPPPPGARQNSFNRERGTDRVTISAAATSLYAGCGVRRAKPRMGRRETLKPCKLAKHGQTLADIRATAVPAVRCQRWSQPVGADQAGLGLGSPGRSPSGVSLQPRRSQQDNRVSCQGRDRTVVVTDDQAALSRRILVARRGLVALPSLTITPVVRARMSSSKTTYIGVFTGVSTWPCRACCISSLKRAGRRQFAPDQIIKSLRNMSKATSVDSNNEL